jgi:hypothetical protein
MPDHTAALAFPNEPALKDGSTSFGAFYPKCYVLAVSAHERDVEADKSLFPKSGARTASWRWRR